MNNKITNSISMPNNISINNSNSATLSSINNFQSKTVSNPYSNESFANNIETIDLSMFVNDKKDTNIVDNNTEIQPVEQLEDFPQQVEITNIIN